MKWIPLRAIKETDIKAILLSKHRTKFLTTECLLLSVTRQHYDGGENCGDIYSDKAEFFRKMGGNERILGHYITIGIWKINQVPIKKKYCL